MERICKFKLTCIVCILFFVLNSCSSGIDLGAIDDKSINIDESLVVPIGDVNLKVGDILSKITGSSNNIDTVNNEIIFQTDYKDEFGLGPVRLEDSIKIYYKDLVIKPATYPANITSYDNPNQAILDMGFNSTTGSDRIDSLFANSADLAITVYAPKEITDHVPPGNFKVEFRFPNSLEIEGGNTLTYIPTAFGQEENIPIKKFKMLLASGQSTINFDAVLTFTPTSDLVIAQDLKIPIGVHFNDINFSVVYGFFKVLVTEKKNEHISLGIEDNFPNCFMKFSNPVVNVTATTNAGADMNVGVDYLKAYNNASPTDMLDVKFYDSQTQSSSNSISKEIDGPILLGDSTTQHLFQYDINSGSDEFFDKQPYPDMFEYKYTVKSNPARYSNFFTPDSKIKLDINAQIPIKLKSGSYITLSDTVQNLNIGTTLDNVDSAIFVLNVSNGVPVKANLHLRYYTADSVEINADSVSLVNNIQINAPHVVNDGSINDGLVVDDPLTPELDGIIKQQIKISLNKAQINLFKDTKYIVFTITFDGETDENDPTKTKPIHITTKSSFGVKLGLYVKGDLLKNLGATN